MMTLPDDLTIPEFLLVKNRHLLAAEPPQLLARAKSTPCRQPRRRTFRGVALPKSIEPAGLEILKDLKRQDEQRKKARLAALKERRR